MYSATCPMLPTQYNIFLPAYPKKGKGYTEEERKERKKEKKGRKKIYFLNNTQCNTYGACIIKII
jgi:hypothetical protein